MPVTRGQLRTTRRPPNPSHPSNQRSRNWRTLIQDADPRKWAGRLLFNAAYIRHLGAVCILLEAVLCLFVIGHIKYTEIDWSTYMIHIAKILNGTRDYALIDGPTGPLVYPAGHVYVYQALYFATGGGDILKGQHIFVLLYLATLAVVFAVYAQHNKIPPYVFVFMCFGGYRIHSIFILRLFNDPIAVLFCYIAIYAMLRNQWTLGCVMYSMAVSVKMNILLFAPGLLAVLLATQGRLRTLLLIGLCGLVQLLLGLPFLLANPVSYVSRAFNLGRVFMYKWTVNFRFLPEETFLDRRLHVGLLLAHVVVLVLFAAHTWLPSIGGLAALRKDRRHSLPPADLLFPLFSSNFIGMAFARSLHYQFYSWYYHSLPFLLFATPFPPVMSLATLGLIEMVWNTYPSTPLSSAALHGLHFTILLGLFTYSQKRPTSSSFKTHAE